MYYNVISQGLTAAAIFFFLIPDQRKETSKPWADTTDSNSQCYGQKENTARCDIEGKFLKSSLGIFTRIIWVRRHHSGTCEGDMKNLTVTKNVLYI